MICIFIYLYTKVVIYFNTVWKESSTISIYGSMGFQCLKKSLRIIINALPPCSISNGSFSSTISISGSLFILNTPPVLLYIIFTIHCCLINLIPVISFQCNRGFQFMRLICCIIFTISST